MRDLSSFEAYVEAEYGGWTDGGRCSACMREAPRLTVGKVDDGFMIGKGDCDECLRYRFGYDEAEARVTRELLYGAVRAAIRAEVAPRLVREAVDRAVDDQYDAPAGEAFESGLRVGTG